MVVRVKEVGRSEGRAVMARIRDGSKASRCSARKEADVRQVLYGARIWARGATECRLNRHQNRMYKGR